MSKPKRIQRKRSKGWKMGDAVYVGRPSKWGNPYTVQRHENGAVIYYLIARDNAPVSIMAWDTPEQAQRQAVDWFEVWIKSELRDDPTRLNALRGKDLCCWCGENEPCHADVLLELANI